MGVSVRQGSNKQTFFQSTFLLNFEESVSAVRMRVQLLVLFALTLLAATMAQQEGGKRRRIKKKIVKNRIVPERRVLVVEGDEKEMEEEVKAEKDVEEQVEAVEEYV